MNDSNSVSYHARISFPDRLFAFEAADQIVKDVADTDRLAGDINPARGDNDRQSFHKVAEDFERGAPRADDHCSSQDRDRYATAAQDAGHLCP